MSAKTGFKRFFAAILSFAMIFSTFAGMLPGTLVFADAEDPEMHIIIKHWHADQSAEEVNATLKSDGSLSCSGLKPDGGNEDDRTGFFDARPDPSETFSGFAVSAGNDCVTLDTDADTPRITVTYNRNVHLVKVHVFYSAKPKLVPGTDMVAGTDGITIDPDDSNGKYMDTQEQNWSTIKDTLQKALIDDGIVDPDALTDDDIIKLYNTSEGLHTDKTATPVYYDPAAEEPEAGTTEEDVEKTGTRVFDINLEAWYNDQATAKVGLILDASGSMAFISSGLEPMQFGYDTGKGYNLRDGTNLDVQANQYLTPEQVNRILKTNLTDNSKLSYSDYSYYIYDTRDFTQEFVPLAYWGGKEKSDNPPIAHYKFDGSLENENGGEAAFINNVKKGDTFDKTTPTVEVSPTYASDNKTLDIAKTAKQGALLADVQATESFTISMRVKANPLSNDDKTTVNTTPLLYVGNGTNYIAVYRSGNNSDPRRLKVDVSGQKEAINIQNLFQTQDKNGGIGDSWVNISLTYDNSTKKVSIDLSAAAKDGKHYEFDATDLNLNLAGADIIIGGDVVKKNEELPYSEVQLTELCVFSEALSTNVIDTKVNNGSDIKKYDNMKEVGTVTGFYDFGDDATGEKLGNRASSGGSLTFIEQAKNGVFTKKELTGKNPIYPVYDADEKALNLTKTSENGGILLDVKPSNVNNFSISFMVKNKSSDTPTKEAELVYMGSLNTTGDYYNIFRSQKQTSPTSGDPKHIRFSQDSNYTGTKANGSNVFTGDWKTVTFTVKDGSVTAYVDGEKTTSGGSAEATLATLSASDFNIILGGLKDEYDGEDILIKDFYIYDKALDETEVAALGSTENKHIAITDDGQIIGTYPEDLEGASEAQRAGWYFVNSGSKLDVFYDPEIGTAKELKGLPADEVIKNEIDLSKLPIDEKVLADIRDDVGLSEGSTEEFLSKSQPVGNGYIATSGKDFTGDGYLWESANTGEKVTVDKKGTEGSDYPVAITMPADVASRTDVYNGYSPCVFFIDDWGYLRCFYNNGSKSFDSKKSEYSDELRSGVSYVFKKDDDKNIKTEDLQYALGEFVAKLHNATPNSMLSAVRFSNQNVNYNEDKGEYEKGKPNIEEIDGEKVGKAYTDDVLKMLVMLDWTSDPKEISQILSLKRGGGESTGADSPETKVKDGLIDSPTDYAQYNYGMTGGTYTWTGFQAYTDFLDSQIDVADKAKKYIILFTDGMDNMLDGGSDVEKKYAVALAEALKEKGYTIFCVVLKNDSFETGADSEGKPNRGKRVQDYMAQIAGNKGTEGKTYDELSSNETSTNYIFEAENVDELTEAFTGEILRQISSSLLDYSVQDYIDPRFDIVDGMGNTIVLGKGGNVTICDEDGSEVDSGKLEELDNKGVININDGYTATLKYDSDKDRYYLEWLKQDIPGTTPGYNSLTVWSRTFRVKAKEDFIGGNAVLSNGNAENENWVFNPSDKSTSSGITDAKLKKEDLDDDGNLKDPYVSKGFPRTAVNVRLLKPTIAEDSDKIYMGETIDPNAVAKDIIQIVKDDYYWEYLKRYYSRVKSDGSDYEAAFTKAIEELLNTTVEKTDFHVENYAGLEECLKGKGIDPTSVNTAHKLTVPYTYLPNQAGNTYTNTVGGEADYQKDQTGSITYMIIQNTPADELGGGSFTTVDTNPRSYIIWVQFNADQIEDDPDDGTDKPREKAVETLVNETVESDNIYPWNKDYKPAAGKEQTEQHIEGPYEVDIVKGEIWLDWDIDQADIDYLKNHFPDLEITYSVPLIRNYTDTENNVSVNNETVGTFKFTMPVSELPESAGKVKAKFECDQDYKNMLETYGLPIGRYSLGTPQSTFSETDFKGFEFNDPVIQNEDEIKDCINYYVGYNTESENPTKDTSDNAAKYSGGTIYLGNGNSDYDENGEIKDGSGTVTRRYTDDRLGLIRISGDPNTGTLAITKNVNYDMASYGNTYDENTEFTFEVELKNADGSPAVGSFSYTIDSKPAGTIGATSNKITLKKDQTATIEGIPVGTTYTVTEVSVPAGYKADSDTATGTITETEKIKSVTVENKYTAYGELTLDIAKVIAGRDWINNDSFEFKVERTDGGDDGAVTMPENTAVTINKDTAEHKTSFDKITFNKVGTYEFKVTETSGNINSLTCDPKEYTVKVIVTNDSSNAKLNVNATYVTVIDGTESTHSDIIFTNTVKPITWSFDVTKTLTGRDWLKDEAFEFNANVSYTGTDEKVTTPVEFTTDETLSVNEGKDTAEFGVKFYSTGIYTFTVKENGTDGNGLDYDTDEHKIVVTVGADATTGALEIKNVTVDENPSDPTNTSLEITNTYKASGMAEFTIQKTLENIGWDGKTFTFTLEPVDGNPDGATIPADIELSSATEQTFEITFSDLTFDGGSYKVYNFTLTENAPNPNPSKGITYDKRKYNIEVTVADNGDGTINPTVKVNGVENGTATFTNTYSAASARWTPQVKKTLTGRDWAEGDSFKFNIELTGGEKDNVDMPSSCEITIGSATPDYTASLAEAIEFNAAGTYVFTISEVKPATPEPDKDGRINGIKYADTEYKVTVVIDDNKEGQLVIKSVTSDSTDYSDRPFEFENEYEPDIVEWAVLIEKQINDIEETGRDENWIAGDEFEFTIELTSGNADNVTFNGENTVTLDMDSLKKTGSNTVRTGEFGKVTFSRAGIYTFTVSEIKGEVGGITYDTAPRKITVTVVDDNKGTLSIDSVTSTQPASTSPVPEISADKATVTVPFTNKHSHKQVSWEPTISKALVGRDWKADESFSFTLEYKGEKVGSELVTDTPHKVTIGNNNAEVTSKTAAATKFPDDAVVFHEVGTYVFKVTEDAFSSDQTGLTKAPADGYEIVVTVKSYNDTESGHTDGELYIDAVTVDGETAVDNNAVLTFTNTYSAASASWTPQVKKTLTGRDWAEGDSFRFSIELTGGEKDNVGMPSSCEITIGSATPDYTASLDEAIEFNAAGTYTFTVTEITGSIVGVDYDANSYEIYVTVEDEGGRLEVTNVENINGSETVTFINNYKADAAASVSTEISKSFTGRDWTDEVFTFELVADPSDKDTVDAVSSGIITLPAPITISKDDKDKAKTFGDIIFTDVVLDKDELEGAYVKNYSFIIKEHLPEGIDEVTHTLNGITYDTRTYSVKVKITCENGTATAVVVDPISNITFNNSYSSVVEEITWAPTVVKTLKGRNWAANDNFTFTLTPDIDNPAGATMPVDTTVTVSGTAGTSDPADATFGAITFTEEGTYVFTIKEEGMDGNGLDYDTDEHKIVVTVGADETTGALEVKNVTVDGVEQANANETNLEITNSYKASGMAEFTIQKTLENIGWDGKTFTFTLTPDVGNPDGAIIPANIELSSETEQTFVITFSDLAFDGVNSKVYNFTLTENGSSPYPGIDYDDTAYTIEVTVADNGDGTINPTVKVNGVENGTATFTNTYSADSASWTPQVKKTLTGRDWAEGDIFTFTLAPGISNPADGFIMPANTAATVSGTSVINDSAYASFDAITFTKAGTYSFTISENDMGVSGMTYDKHVYRVTVIVEDNTMGGLKISRIAYNDKKNPNKTVSGNFDDISFGFENVYNPAPVDWTPQVTKVIANKAVWNPDYVFNFTITPPKGINSILAKETGGIYTENTIAITDIDFDGFSHVKAFPTVTFKAPGVYEFTIQEEEGGISAVTYDAVPRTVIVTVTDVNGMLMITNVSGTDMGSDSNLTVVNTYSTSVPWPPIVEKTINGREWLPSDAFTFELSLDPGFPQDVASVIMPADSTITLTQADYDYASKKATGMFATGVEFTNEGTYRFILREKMPEPIYGSMIGNMIYDASRYIITVEVISDYSSGELSVTSSAVKEDAYGNIQEAGGNYRFTNIYNKAEAEIYVHKELEDWKNGDIFTFDIALTSGNSDEVIMPNPAYVTVTKDNPTAVFGDITFTEAGVYTFDIAEQIDTAKADEIVYAQPQTVTVTVSPDMLSNKLIATVDGGYGSVSSPMTFINSYKTPDNPPEEPTPPEPTASLTLSKVLLINNNITNGVGQFKFRIELIGSDFTDGIFNNGVADVTLASGESITFEGLPAGTSYTVSEYDSYGYTLVKSRSSGLSGTLSENVEARAVAVNVYVDKWRPQTPPPVETPDNPPAETVVELPTEAKRYDEDSVEIPGTALDVCLEIAAMMLLTTAFVIELKRR